MGRIQQLSPQVVAQIAAGEVIERPASVLKELLENSVDAGSSRIDVAVGQGGLEFLRVVDNGSGIDADDLPLAFATHATSKLRNAEDLFQIGTLGFRGEGLASIGSIAQVTLQSCPAGKDLGAEIRCNGGQLSDVRIWNGAPGTRIEARHLFYNTPVRRKFLRGPSTEMSHVSEVFTRLALSQLSLHLTLEHNGRVVHDVPGSAGLLDRIEIFFGADIRRQLIMIEAEQGGLTLGGYVADPICESGGTQMQYVFVNGRWVRDRLISQALQEAYRGLLLTGKHPVAFLFLEIPPEGVDVNVHPTKAEVRFRQPERIQRLVIETVKKHLQKEDLTAPLKAPPLPPTPVVTPPVMQEELPFRTPVAAAPELPTSSAPVRQAVQSAPPRYEPMSGPTMPVTDQRYPPRPRSAAPAPTAVRQEEVRPIKAVQMHDLYLLVEVPEGILVIDQHALHERILFERLKARLAEGKLEIQKLLIPEPVRFTPPQAALLLGQRNALRDLGLEVDDFGGGTVLLGSYPAILGKRQPRNILQAVVEYLGTQQRVPPQEVFLEELMALMACHSAVRAGDRLSHEEIQALVAQRHLAQDSHHCPHGRPSSLLFTRNDLDRQFRRLG